MPYLTISTHRRLETGPTQIGDEQLDRAIVEHVGATLVKELGNNFSHFISKDPPRIVLNKLEEIGYIVVATCGTGQTCIWTLYCKNN